MTGATDGCQLTPSTFPAPCTTSSGPAVTWGPWLRGALTPTSPELGTAAVGKPVQGGKSLRCTLQTSLCFYKSSSCSCYLCLIRLNPVPPLQPTPLFVFPLTIAHPPPEFLSTGIWTAPLWALLPLGPPKRRRRRRNCQTACQSFTL